MGVSDLHSDTEVDDELSETVGETRARSRGGPRGKRGKKVTQVTKREFIEDEDDDDNTEEDLPPLFDLGDIESKSVVRIRVTRKDPAEGMLGYLEDPNANETEIVERWGGSTYRLDGLNQNGAIVIARTVKLAGDPIFVSQSAEIQWRKSRGLPTGPVATGGQPPLSFTEMMTFIREMNTERQKADDDRRDREARERREHDERMRKLEMEADERRRKDEAEREDRRRRDDEERERRRIEAANVATQMQQNFMQAMIASAKQSADQAIAFVKQTTAQTAGTPNAMMDAVKMVVAIKSAFAGDTPEAGEDDPLSLVIKHGHEWLSGIGNAVTGAIREVKGSGVAPQLPAAGSNPALPAPDGGLTIPATSPLAPKLSTLVEKIAAQGRDPEQVLGNVIDSLNATLDGQPPPAPSPQSAEPPPAGQSPAGPGFKPYVDPNAPTTTPATVVPGQANGWPANGHAVKAPARAKFSVSKTARGSTLISFGGEKPGTQQAG